MGHVHSIVEHLISMPKEEPDHLRRRALAIEFHTEIQSTELAAQTGLAQPERGVPRQARTKLDDAVGSQAQLLDRHQSQVRAIRQVDLHLRNDHRADI